MPNVTFVTDEGGTNPTDGGGDGRDGGGDAPNDSGKEVGPPCTPTNGGVEACDDGLDNDCNGATDCQDPACNAFACEPATPSGGWTPVAFADTPVTSCPAGWGPSTAIKWVLGDGTDGSCACTCNGSGGTFATCTGGTDAVSTFAGSASCGGTASNSNFNAQTAACVNLATPIAFGSNDSAQMAAPSGPTTCTPNIVITKNNVGPGTTCAAPAKNGGGCMVGTVCAPKTAALRYCVAKPGLTACPAPFTVRRRAGTDANDPRACNACSCSPATPCSASLTVYSTNNCTGGQNQTITPAGGCAPSAFNSVNAKINSYEAAVTGGCAPPVGFNTTITGGDVTFTGDETICCTN